MNDFTICELCKNETINGKCIILNQKPITFKTGQNYTCEFYEMDFENELVKQLDIKQIYKMFVENQKNEGDQNGKCRDY